jgi:outer membrane receptor protein involved in Fe transport
MVPLNMMAGTKGIVRGKVTVNGEPAYPATVRVEGTSLGARTKVDGTYIISNIEAGQYSLIAGGPEYNDTKVAGVNISADKTTNIDIKLNTDKTATEIVVVADAEMVDNEEIGSQTEITNEEMQRVPVATAFAMVGLSRGVQNTGAGFQIRGSRANESLVQLDGRDIGDQFTGDLGGAGAAYFPQASALATSSVQVIQGGQSAEYGNNMGGVVNTVSKVGRTNGYEGFVSYRTDVPVLYGSQDNGLRLVRDGNILGFEDTPDGNQLQGPNSNRIEAGFGGPLPFLEGSTFYVSTNNLFEEFRSNSFEIYDPAGNNLGRLEGNQSWVKNVTPRLRFKVTDKLEVKVGATWGLTNLEGNSQAWYYAESEGVNPDGTLNGVPEWLAKQNVTNTVFTDAWARFNYVIDNTQFFDITVGTSSNSTYTGRRADPTNPDPNFFTGFDILEPVDNVNVVQGQAYGANERTPIGTDGGPNRLIDFYELSEKTDQLYADGLRTGTLPAINPISGYIEGPGNNSSTDNPYGLPNRFIEHGSQGFSFRDGTYYEVKGNYTNLFETDSFRHNLRGGFEFRYNVMHRLNVGSPWTANGVVDMYTDQWGGNIYVAPQPIDQDAGIFEDVSPTLERPFEPYRFAAFLQDQIQYKGIIFTPGLRFDLFDPQARFRNYEEQPLNFRSIVFIDDEEYFNDATIKTMLAPRINIAYPLTDASNISLNYGVYYQMPQLVWMYDGFNRADLNAAGGSPLVGNPNLEPQRTNSFEVSYNSQLTKDFAVTATTYYKDIYNQLGIVFIPAAPTPVEQTEIAEYGVNQGLELEIRKNPIDDPIGMRVNYTFSQIRGTSDGITTNRGKERDIYTQEFPFPLSDYPLNRDVRHRVNAIIDFVLRDDEGPTIAGIPILENSTINFTGIYASGTPYTRTDIDGQPIGEINAERNPSQWTINSRLQKGFLLRDLFGESMGNTQMNLYVDITNILDRNVPVALNSATGDPLDNGILLETRVGQFPEGPFYASSVPGISRSRATSQYDDFGNRIYNANADANGDQIVTQQELYDAFIGYAEDLLSFRNNFQTPRQVFFGVNIQF